MAVIFYKSSSNGISEKLQRAIEAVIPEGEMEIYLSINRFLERILQFSYDESIAILLTSSRKELHEVISIREQLRDLRIILILPDKEELTVAMGHTLYPRFLSYVDSDFMDVTLVLKRMIDLSDKRFQMENHLVSCQIT
jgi:predicted methyltransferase